MKKEFVYRFILYLTGLLILAFGIVFNTKTGLGVSPIISVSYNIATIWNLNFGDMTFLLYSSFVVVEMILHILMRKRNSGRFPLKRMILFDALQLPLSLIFTRFMNLFSACIPELTSCTDSFWGTYAGRMVALIFAIICTGVGAALSLDMRIIPNPGDGIVQAIADFVRKETGFVKNCFDVFNICISISLGMIFTGHLIGIGVGTVLAVVGVGRSVAFFNYFFLEKVKVLAGMI